MRTMCLDVSIPRLVLTRWLARMSSAAYFAPTACLHLAQIPDPALPAPDWVRVRNRMCGICGSDLHQIWVDAGLDVAPVALPSHQRIYLGHEMVGDVIEVGTGVSDFKIGDRVVRWGRADDCRAVSGSCANTRPNRAHIIRLAADSVTPSSRPRVHSCTLQTT